jgi:hypothetical protein
MAHRRGIHPTRARRGLTFLEVVIAASILAISAAALLELLASTDAVGLGARRQALAAVEVERALERAADALKSDRPMPTRAELQSGMEGEALEGCTLTITAIDRREDFVIPAPVAANVTRTVQLNIRLLVARVETPDGEIIIEAERAVPLDRF